MNKEIERIKELKDLIAYHDKLYFIEDRCEISDFEYDELKKEYTELLEQHPEEGENKVLEADIGSSHLNLQSLDRSMLSLSKVLNREQLATWLERNKLKREDLINELKLDGLGIEVIYDGGKLISILTRGDGFTGEDVTHNKDLFIDLPETVGYKEHFTVRGEAFITIPSFAILSDVTNGKYSTPRNTAAGVLRTNAKNKLDIEPFICFRAYEFIDDGEYETYLEKMDSLFKKTGIIKAPTCDAKVIDEDIRDEIYPVDGVVLKVNSIKEQESKGTTSSTPNWAVAYKFPPLGAETNIKEVSFFTGKTGKVTPVAFYNPVRIGGVICNKASVHNFGIFKKLGLRIGSHIRITRNGDVIPQISHVINHGTGNPIYAPTLCPSCRSSLDVVKGADGAEELFCPNRSSCPAQILNRMNVALGKGGLDIKGIGEILLSKIIEAKEIRVFGEVFLLTLEDLTLISGSEKIATKIFKNIQAAKTAPLNRFIVAMNIPNVGESLARTLASNIKDIKDLPELLQDFNKLVALPDIGISTAMEITEFSKQPLFYEMMGYITENTTPTLINDQGNLIDLAATGAGSISRTELAALMLSRGYRVTSSVNKKTRALLVGNKPNTAKLEKANRLQIPIIELPDNVEDKINTLINELADI